MGKLQNAARTLIVQEEPNSIVSEQYRTLRTNIKFAAAGKLKTLLVTSAVQSEGKSTTAANLAYLLVEEGKKVLFIDGDLRKPTVHFTFSLDNSVGFSLVLSKQQTLEEAIRPTTLYGLHVLTSGPIPPNPAELLGSTNFLEMLAEIEQLYDWIIIDTSPLLAVTDAQILANVLDGTIVVVNVEKTNKKIVKKAINLLTKANAKILGVVMNNMVSEKESYYGKQYYRDYVK